MSRSCPRGHSRTALSLAALIVCSLSVLSPRRADAEFFVPANFDISGVWIAADARSHESFCSLRFDCSNLAIMAGRDWFELKAVAQETGLMETPFSVQGEKRRAVRIEYAGAYHHFHGYGPYETLPDSRRRLNGRFIEEITFALNGTLIYDRGAKRFSFVSQGEVEHAPLYAHAAQVALSTLTNAINVEGGPSPLFVDAAGDAILLNYNGRFPGIPGTLGGSPVGSSVLEEPGLQTEGAGGFTRTAFVRYERLAGSALELGGRIVGKVKPRLIDAPIRRATVSLYGQRGILRAKRVGESQGEYWDTLKQEIHLISSTQVDDSGAFSFDSVPLFRKGVQGAAVRVEAAYYAVHVSHAELDGDPAVFGGPVVYFQPRLEPNFLADTEALVELEALVEIGIKRGLAQRLGDVSELYKSAEAPVEPHLERLGAGSPTLEELEGLRRGIWAERLVLESAESSDALIKLLLQGIGDLIGNVLDDLAPESQRVKKAKKVLEHTLKTGGLVPPSYFEKFGSRLSPGVRNQIDNLREEAVLIKVAEILRVLVKSIEHALRGYLRLQGAPSDKVEATITLVTTALKTILAAIETNHAVGGGRFVIAAVVKKVVEEAHPLLFDNATLPSFTQGTRHHLVHSVDRMRRWSVADHDAYLADSARAAEHLREIIRGHADTIYWVLRWAKPISEVADTAQDVAGVAETIPVVHAIKVASVVIKYLANGATIGLPIHQVYFATPAELEAGVHRSFGEEPPSSRTIRTAIAAPPLTGVYNPRLQEALEVALGRLGTALAALAEDLRADRILPALERADPTASDGFLAAFTAARKAMGQLLGQALAATSADPSPGSLIDRLRAADLEIFTGDLELRHRLLGLVEKIFAQAYSGPEDPHYRADRRLAEAAIDALAARLPQIRSDARSLGLSQEGASFTPLVAVESVTATAASGRYISASPEEVAVRARVRNLSSVELPGLSVRLAITGAADAFEATTALEQPLGGVPLAADDGAAGTGADEAELVWTLRFRGVLEEGAFHFAVEVLEGGEAPARIATLDGRAVIAIDPELSDRDLDGLPDDHESEKGLDPERDDAGEDADGDGVPNLSEYRLGIDARLADTDGDRLSDGEELDGGADGFRTDPLLADTDGDGVADAADRQPVDSGRSETGEAFPEPVVALDRDEVVLTREEPMALVLVSNAGGGALSWTARVGDESIVQTKPSFPERRGEGVLILTVPPWHGFESALETTVQVIDAGGATRDAMTLRVRIAAASGPNRSPVIASGGPRATPSSAAVGEIVAFSVDASDADGDPLSFVWSFGDGSATQPQPGPATTHAFGRAGAFTATVTVTDGRGGRAEGRVVVTVGAGATLPELTRLAIRKLSAKAKFKVPGRDSCTVTGELGDLPPDWSPAGATVIVTVGGAPAFFVLDVKGKSRTPFGTLTLKRRLKRGRFAGGPVTFTAKLRGVLAPSWLDEGVTPDSNRKREPADFEVVVEISGRSIAATVHASLTVKAGKTATVTFKAPR